MGAARVHQGREAAGADMNNQHIIDKILRDVGDRSPQFRLGQRVSDRDHVGVIDAIYANLDAAIGVFIIPEDWYEMQEVPPKTPKTGFWYGVILEEGAALLGEDDLWSAP